MKTMGKPANIILAMLLILGACGVSALAADTRPVKAARPKGAIEPAGCVTPECHANVKDYKALHGPVSVNSCDACHTLTDAEAHTYTLRSEKADLCTFCHEFDVKGIPVVHTPVAKGECLGCHDPHGGQTNAFTRESSMAEMCGRCHESIAHDRQFVHEPVRKGECASCHTAHASKFPKLVHAEGAELCISCHDKFQSQMAQVKFRHGAIDEGCNKCHDAHASNQPKQVIDKAPGLCFGCHQDIQRFATGSKIKHSVVMADRACLTCHTSHGSDLASLMTDLPAKICMDCHNEKTNAGRGAVIAAMPELSDPKTIKHGPIRDGQCSGCHNTHGSDTPLLLVRTNASAFYQEFSEENYGLCFSCHDPKIATEQYTRAMTGFRNGDRNLHFVHANQGTKGRNCSVCHSTHASNNDRHIHDKVPFGKWQLPIGFKTEADGGACSPGCHVPYSYNRVSPVPMPATQPARPPLPVARQGEQAPAPIRWSLRSAGGEAVAIPDGAKPTVLVLIRAEHNDRHENEQAAKLTAAAVSGADQARVIVVLSGHRSIEQAKAMVAKAAVAWPVVADAECRLSEQVEVHVWPTILVLDQEGNQTARLSGTPESLALALAAHVDHAAGRISLAEVADRLTKIKAVGDDPAKKAERQMRLADQLLLDGKTDQARKILSEAMTLQPESSAIRLRLARVLVTLQKYRDAREILDKLPAGAAALGEVEVLRARMMLALGNRADARTVLGAVLKQNPNDPDAHYLVGLSYEQENDWAKAAEAYKAAHEARQKRQPTTQPSH